MQSRIARFTGWCLIAATSWMLSCDSSSRTTTPTSPSSISGIEAVSRDYQARRYEQAYSAAESIHRRSTGAQRQQAAYLAGLSAYQLGRLARAERFLEEAGRSSDAAMAGKAWATLGILHFDEHNYRQSIAAYKNATSRLTGQDKAEAAYRCAQGYQELDQTSQARTQLQIALGASTDPDFKSRIERELRTSGYTLQIGAFSNRANADALAREFQQSSQAVRFGPPRVVRTTSAGSVMYCVHIGTFNSFQSALRSVDQLHLPAYVRPLAN